MTKNGNALVPDRAPRAQLFSQCLGSTYGGGSLGNCDYLNWRNHESVRVAWQEIGCAVSRTGGNPNPNEVGQAIGGINIESGNLDLV